MKILILHLGTLSETLVATSLIKGILKQTDKPDITWVTISENINYVLDYNSNINKVITFDELKSKEETYDIAINLRSDFPLNSCPGVRIEDALGFGFDNSKEVLEYLSTNRSKTMNLFQIYYKLAGLSWRGEGYDIGYFPRSRNKKNRIGIAIDRINMRNYIIDELEIEKGKIWYIPYKKNIFKRMDEINTCNKIITDDIITMHLAIALRKYVYFLNTSQINTKIEMFENGQVINVPESIIQEIQL